MNKWQIESACASTQEMFGVQAVAAAIRRYAGYDPAVRRQVKEGSCVRLRLDETLPANAYRLQVSEPTAQGQQVCLSGADENALMYACMDFANVYLEKAAQSDTSGSPYYRRSIFAGDALPAADQLSAPVILHRGLWTWGHAIYDVRGYLEHMAHLKLNEVIIWNDFLPVNAREVVQIAHSLGIRVIWGYAWGWDTGIHLDLSDQAALDRAADAVVEQYEREYAGAEGDGLYFQSFTETAQERVNGRLIAQVVVDWVNGIAARILERHPRLRLQFGLHASSVRNHLAHIARTDPRVEIIWEDCGDFPYHYMPSRQSDPQATRDFTDRMLSLRPGTVTGAVLKGMICLDWGTFEHQAGPFVLGHADEETIRARRERIRPIWRQIQAEWMTWGAVCQATVRQMAASPVALYALLEDGLFERDIPLPAALFAGLLWNPEADFGKLLRTCAQRSDVTLC